MVGETTRTDHRRAAVIAAWTSPSSRWGGCRTRPAPVAGALVQLHGHTRRAFDLATLLDDGNHADGPATRARLWARAPEVVDAETFGVYPRLVLTPTADP